MKKIIIILTILINLLTIKSVYAESAWTDNKEVTNYFNILETEKRYKWYKEILIDKGYVDITNINLENYYIDQNDYITEESDWTEYDNNLKDNLEFRKWYIYQTVLPLKYIEISKVRYSTKISEIELYNDDIKLNFDIGCSNCNPDEIDNLNDSIIDKNNYFYLSNRTLLSIYINDDYDFKNLKLIIHFINNRDNNSFNIYFTEKQYQYENVIMKTGINIINTDEIISNLYTIDENWTISTKYSDPIETLEEIKPSWDKLIIGNKIESREIIKKFHVYEIKKEYIDGYYKESPNSDLSIKKDENDFKIFYKYEIPEINLDTDNNNHINTDVNTNTNINDILNSEILNIPSYDYLNTINPNLYDYYNQIPNYSDMVNLNTYSDNFNYDELITNNSLNAYQNINDEKEEVIKTDKSNLKSRKIENKNILSNFKIKYLKIISIGLLIIILIILLIKRRYKKY